MHTLVDSYSTVPDRVEPEHILETLVAITSDPGCRGYSTILTTGRKQLLLAKDGKPILGFGSRGPDEDSALSMGSKLMENFPNNLKHLTVLYDNPTVARKLEFEYMKVGLRKGERCIYIISNDDAETVESIKEKMVSFGIDPMYYLSKNLLEFIRIPNPSTDEGGFISGCRKILNSLEQRESGRHIRIIGHLKFQFSTKEEIDGHSELEADFESTYGINDWFLLCNYFVGNYKKEIHSDWARKMLRAHGVNIVLGSDQLKSFVIEDESLDIEPVSQILVKKGPTEFREKIQDLSSDILERDISETTNDIEFLLLQLKADILSYGSSELKDAIEKISLLKGREAMMKEEYKKRTEK